MLDSKKCERGLNHVALLFFIIGSDGYCSVGGLQSFQRVCTRHEQRLSRG